PPPSIPHTAPIRLPPRPPPSPYTTLFRSDRSPHCTAACHPAVRSRTALACAPVRSSAKTTAPSVVIPRPRVAARATLVRRPAMRSEEHTSELQSREKLVCRLLPEKTNRRQ